MKIETTVNNILMSVWDLSGRGVTINSVPRDGVRVLIPGEDTPVEIVEGQVWRHSKSGRLYTVASIGVIEEGAVLAVHYFSEGSPTIWTRPVAAWLEPVLVEVTLPRFQKIEP